MLRGVRLNCGMVGWRGETSVGLLSSLAGWKVAAEERGVSKGWRAPPAGEPSWHHSCRISSRRFFKG